MALRGDVSILRAPKTLEPTEKAADDAVLTEVWDTLRPHLDNSTKRTLRDVLYFTHATSIQKMTIPVFCRRTSVVVEASTGSGKTLGFLLPVLHRIIGRNKKRIQECGEPIRSSEISAIVLSPSRTLTRQTFLVCRQLVNGADHNIQTVLWGDSGNTKTNIKEDTKKFTKLPPSGGRIVVGTPGAVLDMLKAKKIPFTFSDNLLVVIDEADVILDQQSTICEKLLNTNILPWKGRQFGLFGATVRSTPAVHKFIAEQRLEEVPVPKKIVKESTVSNLERDDNDAVILGPDIIDDEMSHEGKIYTICDTSTTLINLRNTHVWTPAAKALSTLVHLIGRHKKKKHFIFFNNSATLEYVSRVITIVSEEEEKLGLLWKLQTYNLHPEIPEKERAERFKNFLSDPRGVLLSTDECAFGIDVREVDYVLHFQPPTDGRTYTHRIGRTGRMGCAGTSVLLLPHEMRENLSAFVSDIEKEFDSLEYRLPVQTFDSTRIVQNLLSSVPEVRDLAIQAACACLSEATSRESAIVNICSLGISSLLAEQLLQSVPAFSLSKEAIDQKIQTAKKASMVRSQRSSRAGIMTAETLSDERSQ
eukprot:TRINITY_DN10507_c0_g1_i2.p1 TRINITY_DN10507_c0_g1~~TRINITY_DN10507_c0_g1_i2.p1  ORF type:complete len:589 (+),score=98.87 TRINITY_DN10507_c0_g1_i2:61-1827(+)